MSDFVNDPNSQIADAIRKAYREQYNIDTSNFSNEQLIFKHGQDLEKEGLTMSDIKASRGEEFVNQYYDIKNRPQEGRGYLDEIGLGFGRGMSGQMGMGSAALGLASGSAGLDGAEDYFMEKAEEFQDEAAQSTPTVERFSDVRWDRPQEVARFLLGGMGEAVPSFISSLAGFGGGGLVGQQVAKQALRKTIKERADKSVGQSVRDLSQELLKQQGRKGFAIGASVGTAANSFGLSTGEIYSELHPFTQLSESNPDYVDPSEARKLSLGFGMLSGSLDFLSAGTLLSRITGAKKEASANYLKRLLYALPEGVILEGSTEAAQEFINVAASKYARGMEMEFSNQEIAQLIDAGVMGAIGGSQFAAVGAIKGPAKPMIDEPKDIEPGDQTEETQKELLDYIQEARGKEFNYKPGDRVQVGFKGVGELLKVVGDEVQVKLDSGEIVRVGTNKLSREVVKEEAVEESNTKRSVTYPEDDNVDAKWEEEEAPKVPRSNGKPPTQTGNEIYTKEVNGEDKLLENLSVIEKQDITELVDTMLDLADNGMSKNTDYANKTGGFAPVASALKSRMGQDKFKRLWKPDNIQRLRDLGMLNYSNTWLLPTKLDKQYDEKVFSELKDSNQEKLNIRKSWLHKGAKVKLKGSGGVIAEVEDFTDDGLVKLKEFDAEFYPDRFAPVRQPSLRRQKKVKKVRAVNPWVTSGRAPQGVYEKDSNEQDQTEPNLLFTRSAEDVPQLREDFDTKGKKLEFVYRQGKNNRRVVTKLGYDLDGTEDSVAKAVRDFATKAVKKKKGYSLNMLKTLEAIEIDGEQFDNVVIDFDEKKGIIEYIEVSGMEVDPKSYEELEAKKGDIPFPIQVIEVDAPGIDRQRADLDDQISDNSVPRGNRITQNVGTSGKNTRVAVVLQETSNEAAYPFDSIRVLTMTIGETSNSKRLKVADPDLGRKVGGRQEFIDLKGLEGGRNMRNWKIVGKITSSKPIGTVDLYFSNMEEFLANEQVSEALERAQQETIKENKKFASAKKASATIDQKKERLEELSKLSFKELEKPTEEDFRDARDELYTPEADYEKITPTEEDRKQAIKEVYEEVRAIDESAASARTRIIQEASATDDSSLLWELEDRREAREMEIARERSPDEQIDFDLKQEKAIERRAKKIAKERASELKAEYNALKREVAEDTKEIQKSTGEGTKYNKELESLKELSDRIAEEKKKPKDAKDKLSNDEIKDLEDAFQNMAQRLGASTYTGKGDFIDNYAENDEGTSASDENQASGNNTASDQAWNKGAQFNSLNQELKASRGEKRDVVDIETAISGRDLTRFENLEDVELMGFIKRDSKLTKQTGELIEYYIEEKKGQEVYSDDFVEAVNQLAVDIYKKHVGSAIKAIQKADGSKILDIGPIAKKNPNNQGMIDFRMRILEMLEVLDQGKGSAMLKKHGDKVRQAKDVLKQPISSSRSYDLFNKFFEHVGVYNTDNKFPVYERWMELQNDPVLNATELGFNDLINIVNEGIEADKVALGEVMGEVYGVTIEETDLGLDIQGFETPGNYDALMDDLMLFVNKDHVPSKPLSDENDTTFANRYSDPRAEARLNPNERHIPNKISPVTGKVDNKQVLVMDEQTAEMSIQSARDDEQSYMSPAENPLDEYPDLLEEGRAAMNDLAPGGIGVEFGMSTALNNIQKLDVNPAIKNIARLLDNDILKGYKVSFMEWEQFRPYASPSKGVLNKAVALPRKKKIYISTAFNNSYNHSASDLLAADIVHEALHAVTKPALDLGYAFSNGNQDVIKRALADHGTPDRFNADGDALAKIFNNINEKLLPHLRQKASLNEFYGLSSIDEFFSELASNPKFQNFLSQQKLPKSLSNRGILQTALDYVLAILAKLGMKSAGINEDAMSYSMGEMKKLINISNGMSALHDSIESRNLRNINQLASRFDGGDIINTYDELLERFSRETPPESDGSLIKDLSNLLKGSTRKEQETSERKRAEAEALEQYAKANGVEISRASFQEGLDEGWVFGGEHEVYHDETQMRFFKANTHDTPATAFVSDYLDRLALHNSLFPDAAYRVEGIMTETKTSPSGRSVKRSKVVVSQEAIIGDDPSQAQIDDHMASIGFDKLEGYDKPIYRKGDIDVWDVRPGNAAVVDGNLVIFDPRIDRVTKNELNQEKVAKEISEDGARKAMIEQLVNGVTDIDELIGLMDEMDNGGGPILGNQFTSPSNDFARPPNSRPDDNARVMAQANAAGFGELVDEMTLVHREYGEKLGLDLKEFLDIYGRPGGKKLSKIRSLLQKDLEAFEDIDPDDIRIEDAGLNKVSRLFGVRKAIQNLERVREKARKNKASSAYIIDEIEDITAKNQRIYEDLIEGRLPGKPEMVKRVKGRLRNISFQKLEEFARSLPNAGISQADLNSLKDITDDQLGDIMDAVVEKTVLNDGRGLKGFAELEYADKEDLVKAIENSNDLRLQILKGTNRQTRLKRLAVAMAIRDSRDVLSLLRLSKGILGPLDLGWKDIAENIALAQTVEELESIKVDYPGVAGSPLKYFIRMRKEELNDIKRLEQEKAQMEVYDYINRSLGDRSARLRMALGELEPVSIHDGVTLVTLERDKNEPTGWKKGTYKVEFKNGKMLDREGFIKANKDTLMGLRDEEIQAQYGNEPWWEIMREQAELAMAEPVLDEHFHAQRAAWYAGLQGLTERFQKLGYEGKKIAQMGTRTVALYRDYAGKSMAYSKQFNASAHRVMSALKIGGNEFYSGIYQDIFWWFDNHPEYAGREQEAFAELWKHLRENGNISNPSLMNEEARRLTKDMINKAIQARDWEAEVNKKLGNRVRDDEIKVESFINQEMVDFYRLPLEMGFATMPRTLNDSYLRQTYQVMKDAWGGVAQDLLKESALVKTEEEMSDIYSSLFTDSVVERFVKPYTNTDVRQSVFRGPKDEDGHSPQIGNSFVNEAFKVSKGDVYEMSNFIYDNMAEEPTDAGRLEWQHNFLKQWFSRYNQISKVAGRATKQKHGLNSGESMQNTPQSLDARMVESRLPKEFFYYNMYDEVSSNIRLALMTATASFGRNGENANRARVEGVNNMEADESKFNDLMSVATNSRHEQPRAHYSKAVKRKAFQMLREQGFENAEKKWNELYSKAIAVGEFRVVFDQLGKYYGKDNVAGPYQDANLLLEILGVQSIQVLNNPKSSFWQALSMFEFPLAFRGLNKMAGKATTSALGNFVDQTFGGMVEAMGMTLDRTGTYAQYLNDTHFRMDEMDLEFKEYNSMLGSGGDLAESIRSRPTLGLKRYIRMAKNLATHHRRRNKDGTRAPIDPLTPFTGIFPYMNNVINHSIGVGAIHAYSDLVIKAANVIEQRDIRDYQELTAQDLGMGNKTGEWIIGEEDGFKRANEILVASGAPSISRLAFDYVDRKKSNANALPIEKNMALLINQAAMNNVAGEGFNSKPSWLYTSPGMRYFSTFLGWPLGKMGRDLQFIIRDSSDKVTTYKALLKYLGLLSAVYVPAGLSFAMLIDWYDEEMLEKPNSLPPMSPWAALPVLGLPLAMRDENFSIYSITSRLAKAGVPFGMGMDIVNGIFAKGDPYGSARELSLDSRIFAFSMFKNIYDAVGTWIHAGEFDWQLVGRPIAYGVGGNSVIQMMDLTTALFDIDSEERRVADYIGMRNYIKKTAFMMGLPLRPPRKGGGIQTGVSINTRQMARAAYNNDTESFLENYQEAMDEARVYLEEQGRGDEDPAKYVSDAFKDRDLRFGITQRRISDQDWQTLLALLPPDVRVKIQGAMESHESYLRLIGGKRRTRSMTSQVRDLESARRAAMLLR